MNNKEMFEYTLDALRLPKDQIKEENGKLFTEFHFFVNNKKYYIRLDKKENQVDINICDNFNRLIFSKSIHQENKIWLHETNKEDGEKMYIDNEKDFLKLMSKPLKAVSEAQIEYIITRDNKVKELGIGY